MEDDTKYNWLGESQIICIGLTDLQLDDELLLQVLEQPLDIPWITNKLTAASNRLTYSSYWTQ